MEERSYSEVIEIEECDTEVTTTPDICDEVSDKVFSTVKASLSLAVAAFQSLSKPNMAKFEASVLAITALQLPKEYFGVPVYYYSEPLESFLHYLTSLMSPTERISNFAMDLIMKSTVSVCCIQSFGAREALTSPVICRNVIERKHLDYCLPCTLDDVEFIFFPILIGGHWLLGVFGTIGDDHVLRVFDSMNCSDLKSEVIIQLLLKWLENRYSISVSLRETSENRAQGDSISCGIFAIEFALSIIENPKQFRDGSVKLDGIGDIAEYLISCRYKYCKQALKFLQFMTGQKHISYLHVNETLIDASRKYAPSGLPLQLKHR